MNNPLPNPFLKYWRGKTELPQEEQQLVNPEELGKEWRELLEAIQEAAKREWKSK